MVIALLFAASSYANTNSWTKTSSGYWEEPFWSLGHLPSAADEAIAVTNPGFKALAIGSSTTANYPGSLQINDLYVDAPTNSHNLLLLNYAGLNLPLTTATTHIGRDGSLLSYYSVLRANRFAVNGQATFAELAESQVGEAWIGTSLFNSIGLGTGYAELTLSNGLFSASQIHVGDGVPGVFNQYGGVSQAQSLGVGAEGVYSLYDGTLNVTNSVNLDATPQATARLNIADGTAEMTELQSISNDSRAKGELFLSGGTLRAARVVANNARFNQTGGRAEIGDITFPFGNASSRTFTDYSLSGGLLISSNVLIGPGYASVYQSGGVHTNLASILLSGPAGTISASFYSLGDALLVSPRIDVDSGYFTQNRGTNYSGRLTITHGGYYAHGAGQVGDISTNRTEELVVNNGGGYGMVVGAQLWTSNTTVQFNGNMNVMYGHHHVANRLFIDSGGRYTLASGTLGARFISLDAGGTLVLSDGGGTITTNEAVILRNTGTITVAFGDYQFGELQVPGSGIIDFPTTGPNAIRFVHAGFTNGGLSGELRIQHWTPNGDHLYIGHDPSAITPDQLSLTHFIDPEGYPAGTYAARVTATGEIVPREPGRITFTRSSDNSSLTLTWPEDYQLLTATEVTGPYTPVPNATSPYHVSFTDPRRFFKLVPAN